MRFTLVAVGLLVGLLMPGSALAQEQPAANPRAFPDTGYTIADDAIWTYFNDHGGSAVFGLPISRELTLLDAQVQLFENAALAVQPDGTVAAVPLASTGLLPYQRFDGLTVPAIDPALAFITPSPEQPNYAARLGAYLGAAVSPNFSAIYAADVWGLPTSAPRADPNNPNFVYQRFQNGVLLADLTSGSVGPLPLGTYLKAILTGQDLPPDLATEAATSPLFKQFATHEAFTPDAA